MVTVCGKSINTKIAVAMIILTLGLVLEIFALSTRAWSKSKSNEQGVLKELLKGWKRPSDKMDVYTSPLPMCRRIIQSCVEETLTSLQVSTCHEMSYTLTNRCDAIRVVAMLLLIGLILAFLALVVGIMSEKSSSKKKTMASGTLCIISFLLIAIALLIWVIRIHNKLSTERSLQYSFYASLIGALLTLLAGGILIHSAKG